MNKKRFFQIFIITTLVLLVAIGFFACQMGMVGNIGANANVKSLDKVKSNERRNILVLGTDEGGQRSDVIMIFSFPPDKGTINVLSVPRDTKVKIGSHYQKINAALAIGGEDMTIQKVKEVTGISIHDVAKVNFNAVKDAVDALGGVDFEVPQDMDYDDPAQNLHIHLKKGMQHLNGTQAVQLLRFRTYPLADLTRIQVQKDFIKAAFEQKATLPNLLKIPSVYSKVSKNTVTSMSLADVKDYAGAIQKNGISEMKTFELPNTVTAGGEYVIVNAEKTKKIVDENFK